MRRDIIRPNWSERGNRNLSMHLIVMPYFILHEVRPGSLEASWVKNQNKGACAIYPRMDNFDLGDVVLPSGDSRIRYLVQPVYTRNDGINVKAVIFRRGDKEYYYQFFSRKPIRW